MRKVMLLVLTLALALSAAFVPMDRAKTIAENQFNHYCLDSSAKSAGNVVKVVENKYEGETTWYAFEFEQGGFVIVAADDAVRPVLGYSEHGKIVDLDTPGGHNFKEWFGNYDREIAYMRSNSIVDEVGQKTWKDVENNIFPSSSKGIVVDRLIRTEWDQIWPWNDDLPLDGGEETYVGCVATAMSQVLRYHEWPDVGVGSGSYTCPTTGAHSADFTSHTWDYSLMPETVEVEYGLYPSYWYEASCSQAEIDEMALFCYWLGISVEMNYTKDGSGAYSTDVDNAFLDHWKASSSVYSTFTTPTAGGSDGSYNTILTQLQAGRPWYWSGNGGMGTVGHAFNLDGARDDHWYHFNWGWGGSYHGWFHRSSLTPDGIGSGGGAGDYSQGQAGVTYTPSRAAFATTTLSGSLVNDMDASLSWQSKSGATGYSIYRRTGEAAPVFLTTVTGTSYTDANLPVGNYVYLVKVEYTGGESNWSNQLAISVVDLATYPRPRSLTATTVGRTNIDLTWIAPAAGVTYTFEDFNASLDMPSGWTYQTANDGVAGKGPQPGVPGGWGGDDGMGLLVNENDYSGVWADGASLIGAGNFFILSSNTTAQTQWLLSPAYTFDAGAYIEWTGRFRYTEDDMVTDSGHRPQFEVVTTTDLSFSITGSEAYTIRDIPHTIHRTCTSGPTGDPGQYLFDQTLSATMGAASGDTAYAGFKTTANPYYSICFDDILVGSTSGGGTAPTGYALYRNESHVSDFADNVFSYTDYNFIDGDNTYYVKSLYSGNESIPSSPRTVNMDANPDPGYLSGTVSPDTQANLSWYMPYHHAPKWYAYVAPEDCFSTTQLDGDGDGTPDINMNYRRVIFNSADLGYYYPVTLDSIAGAFYDDAEGNWGGNDTFVFRIWYESEDPLAPTVLHTSPTLTAVHNQITTYGLTTPIQLTEDFNIEIVTDAALGQPWSLMGYANGGTHSYFQYDPGDGASYSYGITFGGGDSWAEWNHMVYLHSSEPAPIAKSGWVGSSTLADAKAINVEKPVVIKNAVKSSKALDYYKIYRDGTEIGTSTTLNYSDSSVPADGNYDYTVSAYYSNPVGESDQTAPVNLFVKAPAGGTPAILSVSTAVVGSDVRVSWTAENATSYDVYTSADPYGTFSLLGNTTNLYYDYTPGTNAKMFFYIKAKN